MIKILQTFWLVTLFVIASGKTVHASTNSFVLQTYLNQVDQMIQSNQFSDAKRSLILLEALFPNNAEVQEKSKELAIKDYQETYLKNMQCSVEELAWTGDINKCRAGTVSKTAIAKSLAILNYFRRQAGLYDQCEFVDSFNIYCQQTALVLYANNIITHYLDKSNKCFTEMAKVGALSSNLSLGNFGPNAIQSQVFDNGWSNYSVGHRRWILNPFNSKFGIGITPGSTALGVFGKFSENNDWKNKTYYEGKQYIAWPSAGYFPTNLVPQRWSFSLHRASFESVIVNVYKYKNGKKTAVEIDIEPVEDGYGINTLVWKPRDGWEAENESVFEVEIKNVYLKSGFGVTQKDQSYNFSYKITTLDM